MRRSTILASGLALVLAAGCSGGSKAPTAHPAKDPRSVLAAAQQKTTAAKSAKLTMSVVATVKGQSTTLSGDRAFDFANKLGRMSMTVPSPGAADITMDMVYSGTLFYLGSDAFQSIAGKHWLKVDLSTFTGDTSKLGAQDPSQGLEFLAGTKDAKVVGTEKVHGAQTTHYSATIDLAATTAKLGAAQKKLFDRYRDMLGSTTMPVDVWVDDAGRVARMTTATTIKGAGTPASSTVTIEYFDWGSPVHVTLPPAAQVGDGNALLGQLTG